MPALLHQGFSYNNVAGSTMVGNILTPALILLGFWLLEIIATRYILPGLYRHGFENNAKTDNRLALALVKPVRILILLLGFYLALMNSPLVINLDLFLSRFFRSGLIIVLAWTAGSLTGKDSVISEEFSERLRLDNILTAFFSKVIKFLIWAMAVVLIAHEWNYDVSGFIAGLGLGGLAFALAAKDALANIFGGIVIIMEKPFSIGDLVQTDDVEGTVEAISFRSTRFRTLNQALVTVPNSNLANNSITNLSRMGKRLIKFTLSIDYIGPREKIEYCVMEIRELIKNNPAVYPQTISVYLERVNINSLDIFVCFYTNTVNWEEYLKIKEDINYQILDVLMKIDCHWCTPAE